MAKESYASRYRQVEHHLHTLLAQKKIVLMGKIGDQVNDQRFLLMFSHVSLHIPIIITATTSPLRIGEKQHEFK